MAESIRHIEPLLPRGGPQTVNLTAALETDSAQALIALVPTIVALTAATETDTAQALTPHNSTFVTLTPATETDSAVGLLFTSNLKLISNRRGGVYPRAGIGSSSHFSTGTTTWHNQRLKHTAHANASAITLIHANSCLDQTTSGAGVITIRAGLELPDTTIEKVYWSGVDNVTLAIGEQIISDPCAATLDEGDTFYVRTNTTVASGEKLPCTALTEIAAGEGGLNGSGANTNDAWSGTLSASFNAGTTDLAVLGSPDVEIPSVCVIGDSIEYGSLETETGMATRGYIGKALSGVVPHCRLALGGEASYQFLTDYSERLALIEAIPFTDAIVGQVRNDLRDGRTVAQIKTSMTAIYDLFPDARVWGLTSPPYDVSSTDGYITSVNQTPDTVKDDKRQAINDWIIAGADGALHGYFDVGAAVTDGTDDRKWKSTGGTALTSDGIHPNLAGHTLMAGQIDTGQFAIAGPTTLALTVAAETDLALALTAAPIGHIDVSITPATETDAAQAFSYSTVVAPAAATQRTKQLGELKIIKQPEVYTLP